MNKKELRFLQEYINSHNRTIYDCYDKPSENMVLAYEETRNYMESIGGKSYRILSYNSHTFTCGFIVDKYLYVITKKNNLYKIKVED